MIGEKTIITVINYVFHQQLADFFTNPVVLFCF